MKWSFHPEAETEFYEAIDYYEECEPGLGEDFAIEVHATIQHILTYPETWPTLEGDVRRCLTSRFPYGVLYSIEPAGIFILAVMHLHRDPDYWKHRE
jgi:plasmid stabilization system protein ParE